MPKNSHHYAILTFPAIPVCSTWKPEAPCVIHYHSIGTPVPNARYSCSQRLVLLFPTPGTPVTNGWYSCSQRLRTGHPCCHGFASPPVDSARQVQTKRRLSPYLLKKGENPLLTAYNPDLFRKFADRTKLSGKKTIHTKYN